MLRPLFALAVFTVATSSVRADKYNAYAGPNTWGPVVALKGHLGAATYTLEASPVGDTQIIGEVTYVSDGGHAVTRQFNGTITFRVGKFVGAPTVRFKEIPLGSAVTVSTK